MWQMKWFLSSQLQSAETSAIPELWKPISTLEISMLRKIHYIEINRVLLNFGKWRLWRTDQSLQWRHRRWWIRKQLDSLFPVQCFKSKAKLFNRQICWNIILKICLRSTVLYGIICQSFLVSVSFHFKMTIVWQDNLHLFLEKTFVNW